MKTIAATIILKKADFWDLFYNANKKRVGQPFWIKSIQTGNFDNKAYLVGELTDSRELKGWIEQGMLYVPASDLDLQSAQTPEVGVKEVFENQKVA